MRLFEIADREKIITETLKNNCSEFLKVARRTGCFLYRGTNKFKEFFTAESPVTRHPQGQTSYEQHILDGIFQSLGFTALRSNSICCTSAAATAKDFGDVLAIFPHNGFSFTWSPIVNDVGSDLLLGRKLNAMIADMPDIRAIETKGNEYFAALDRKFHFNKQYKFTNMHLAQALESGNEIAVSIHLQGIVTDYFGIELGK